MTTALAVLAFVVVLVALAGTVVGLILQKMAGDLKMPWDEKDK